MSETTSRRTSHAGEGSGSDEQKSGGLGARLAIAWTFVGIPLAYGIYETAKKAAALFTG